MLNECVSWSQLYEYFMSIRHGPFTQETSKMKTKNIQRWSKSFLTSKHYIKTMYQSKNNNHKQDTSKKLYFSP